MDLDVKPQNLCHVKYFIKCWDCRLLFICSSLSLQFPFLHQSCTQCVYFLFSFVAVLKQGQICVTEDLVQVYMLADGIRTWMVSRTHYFSDVHMSRASAALCDLCACALVGDEAALPAGQNEWTRRQSGESRRSYTRVSGLVFSPLFIENKK